jgi:thioredoxin
MSFNKTGGMYRPMMVPESKTLLLLFLVRIIVLHSSLSIPYVLSFGGVVDCHLYSMRKSKNCNSFQTNRVSKSNVSCSTFTDDSGRQDSPLSPPLGEPSSNRMSIKEIKEELKAMNISFADCFDKDSLMERLDDARKGKVSSVFTSKSPHNEATSIHHSDDKKKDVAASTTASTSIHVFNREAVASDLRTKTVRQLRTLCAANNIRWANLIEKEELVQALVQYQEQCFKFSSSGKIMPRKVALVDDETLAKELAPAIVSSSKKHTPLMLDVFATWCGPCKMMSPQLEDAAVELGDQVRVAKIDSDKFPEWASKLNVRSLPTIIMFDGKTGKEVERVEGALMKEQLVTLARKYVS